MKRFFGHTPLASFAPLSSHERARRVLRAWFAVVLPPSRPGHTPLASLRSLAPLSLCERGRRVLRVWFAVVVPIVVAVVFACGGDLSDGGGSDVAEVIDETAITAIGDRLEISAWTRPNREFGYDEFIEAGWKQHQVYEVDTLPNALEARYGFYNRRDVEIRRYASHELAMSDGAASAEEALDRTVHDGSGFASRRVYRGYLVAGNLVMMCEVSTDDCIKLIEAAEGGE